MARYFFDLSDGGEYRDDDGVDLSDLYAAQIEAVQALADRLRDRPREFLIDEVIRITVTDERRMQLFFVEAFAMKSPAAEPGAASIR